MGLKLEEQETVITLNRKDDYAVISTNDKFKIKELDELCRSFPEMYKCISKTEYDSVYHCSKKYIKFKRPYPILKESEQLKRSQRIKKTR